jgi:hypothetical protein
MKPKIKLKLDGETIKGFFVTHGEKIGVGIALFVMLIFVTGAFKRETLPQNLQAESVTKQNSDANSRLVNTKPPADPPIPPVDGRVVPVPPNAYDIPPIVNTGNVFNDPNKNADPKLFPIIDLQAHGFRGAIALAGNGPLQGGLGMGGRPMIAPQPIPATVPDKNAKKAADKKAGPAGEKAMPPAASLFGGMGAQNGPRPIPGAWPLPGAPSNGNVEARYGVMITGAIPEEAIQKSYEGAFAHAMKGEEVGAGPQLNGMGAPHHSSDNTKPQYIAWRLERTEIDSAGKPIETRTIDTGDVTQVLGDIKEIGKTTVMGSLKPTGGFVKRQEDVKTWSGHGEEVVSPECLGAPWLSWPLPPMILHDWGREATSPKLPLVTAEASDDAAPGAAPAVPDAGPAKKPDDDPFGKSADAGPSRMVRDPMAAMQQAPRPHRVVPGGPEMLGMQNQMPTVPYRLFRYVDFDVQPGRQYQYRVQLVVRNPNYGKDPHILFNPDSGKVPYRDTPWSEKTAVAMPPVDTRVVADSVVKPRLGDLKGKVLVLEWFGDEKNRGTDKPYALELMKDFELEFGAIANGGKELKEIADATTRMIREFKEKDAVFASNAALLDVHGGLDAKGKSDSSVDPAEILLVQLDEKGRPTGLFVTNQARDKQLPDDWTATHNVPQWANEAQNMGGGTLLGPTPPPNSLLTPKTPGKTGGGGRPTIGGKR